MADEQQKPRRKGKAIRAVVILAVIAVLAVAGWILAKTVIIPKLEDARVQSLIDEGDYEAAFALREEQRGAEAADALKREVAAQLIERNNFDAAYTLLREVGDEEAVSADKRRRADALIVEGDFDAAYALLEEVGDEEAISADKRRRADALIAEGDFDAAYALLEEVGDEEAISADKRRRADALIAEGDFDAAYALLEEVGDEEAISADKYRRAEELIGAGDYTAAAALLMNLDGPDSAALLESIWEPYLADVLSAAAKAQPGDYITFGSYEQDNDPANGSEPIEWIVAAKEGDRVELLCAVGLDCVQYNTKWTDVTWETCSLRAWLNGTFLNEAFSPAEQSRILTTEVPAGPETDYGTNPGRNTADKVFLLSVSEAEDLALNGLTSLKDMQATEYAAAQGAEVYRNGMASWWLRSPGAKQNMAAYYVYDGSMCGIVDSGIAVSWIYYAVRPVIWIDVSG